MRLKSLLFALLLLCFAPCQISAQSVSPAKGGYARIGVLVAMEKEMKMLKDCFTDDRVVIRQCGMGKVNAAVGCAELIRDCQPDVVISLGCAGGQGADVHLGDAVVSTALVYHDVYCGSDVAYGQIPGMPLYFKSDSTLLQKALELGPKVVPGLIVTGDWFVDTKAKMREIIGHFSAARAVDMESAAIAQVCYIHQVPFISFRIVSDKPLEDEHASQYVNFWDTVSDTTFSLARRFIESLL